MKRLLLLIPLAFGLLAATAAACGDSDDDASTPTAPAAPTTATVQEITIRGLERGEEYVFDPQTVNVRPGTVRVNFINDGPERPHSFVVKNKAGDADIINSDRVELGQSKMLEFTVTEQGAYKFVCTIRGHEDRGMTGTLNVSGQTAVGQ